MEHEIRSYLKYSFSLPKGDVNELLRIAERTAYETLGFLHAYMGRCQNRDLVDINVNNGDYYLFFQTNDKEKWRWTFEDIFSVKKQLETILNVKVKVDILKNGWYLPDISDEYESNIESAKISGDELAKRIIRDRMCERLGINVTTFCGGKDSEHEDSDVITAMRMILADDPVPWDLEQRLLVKKKVKIIKSEDGYNQIEPYIDNIENIVNDEFWQYKMICFKDIGDKIVIHYFSDETVSLSSLKKIKGFVRMYISPGGSFISGI